MRSALFVNPFLVLFFASMLLCNRLGAFEILESDFSLNVLHKDFYAKLIADNFEIHKEIELSSAVKVLNSSLPVKLEGISIRAKLDSKLSGKHLKAHKFVMPIQVSRLKIQIDRMSIDHTIERQVQGNTIRTRILGSCEALSLDISLPSNWFYYGELSSLSNKLRLREIQLQVLQLPKDPKISIGECRGVSGASNFIQEEILKALSDKAFLEQLTGSALRDYLDDQLNSLNKDIFSPKYIVSSSNISSFLLPKTLVLQEDGSFLVLGKVIVYLGSVLDREYFKTKILSSKFDTTISTATSSQIRLSKEFLRAVFDRAHENSVTDFLSMTDEVPALKSLMASKFKQYYVWRDFRNFPLKTNVKFEHKTRKPLLLKELSKLDSELIAEFESDSRFHLQVPKESSYIDYADLDMQSKFFTKILPSKDRIEISNSAIDIQSQHYYNPSYLAKYKVKDKVSHSRINKEVKKLLNSSKYNFENPKIVFSEFMKALSWQKSSLSGDDIILDLLP